MEVKYPVMYENYGLIADSGGAGRQRGGLGIRSDVRLLKPLTVSTRIERMNCKPWGLEGGLDGNGNEVELEVDGEERKDTVNAKVFTARLSGGDMVRIRAGGGGGFGPPWERPAAKVREDVRQGYVSLDAARDEYGVALDAETLAIIEDETERLRAQLAAA